ncbi:MAG: DUF5654 family protein [Patescibacteria group bacterium]
MPIDQKKPGETEHQLRLHLTVLQKILELMTAAFSLVAALAWNDAIQSLFAKIFGTAGGIVAKFIYALLITGIVVWIGLRLSKISKLIEQKSQKNP